MCVETWGIIKKKTSVKRIQEYLKEKYTDVMPVHSHKDRWCKNLFNINFHDGNDARCLSIIQHDLKFPGNPEDYWVVTSDGSTSYFNKSSFTVINLNYWGNAVEIIKDIIEHFGGGFICECDTHCIYRKVEK